MQINLDIKETKVYKKNKKKNNIKYYPDILHKATFENVGPEQLNAPVHLC